MSKRDRFLTKKMGLCWHDKRHLANFLTKHLEECECGETGYPESFERARIDFSGWEGFGRLWTYVEKEEWFQELIYNIGPDDTGYEFVICTSVINPDKFADAVYLFLMEQP